MTVYCDQTSHTILKFVGVFPQGVNRLHDAIEVLNRESPFKESERKKVELLSSKFSHEHGSYVVEVQVPFEAHTGQYCGGMKVPQSCIARLFEAIGEFQRQERHDPDPVPADEVEWVVNDLGELGVRIHGRSYFLYKGESIVYEDSHEDGTRMMQRRVQKREFGEVCRVPGFEIENVGEAEYFEGDGWFALT